MPFRYLSKRGERPQTDGMRLPLSHARPFSIRAFFFILTVTVSAVMMPLSAGATAKQLTGAPSALSFGNVIVGHPETEVLVLRNGGQTSITVSAMKLSATEFRASGLSLPLTLHAGQSAALNVTFSPTRTGWRGGWIFFTSNASNSTLDVQLQGTGATSESVTASPSSVSFGQVAVGTRTTHSVVLTNRRAYNERISSLKATGGGFSVSGPALPITLHAGQSTTVTVAFVPPSAGTSGGSLFVFNENLDVPLTGTGTTTTTAGKLSITPTSVNFGDVNVGATGTEAITMSATGANVTVSSDSSSSSQFVLQGASLPFTIPAGQSVAFNVVFNPTGSGTVSGSLSFTSNAASSQTLESLTGTGTATQYSVNLRWNASPGAMGYNLYRSTTSNGAYTKINSTVDANTAYTDSAVAAGQVYYYQATSVSSTGQESVRSTPPLEVSIP